MSLWDLSNFLRDCPPQSLQQILFLHLFSELADLFDMLRVSTCRELNNNQTVALSVFRFVCFYIFRAMWPLGSRETFLKNQSFVTYWKIKVPCFGLFAAELSPIKRDFYWK